MVLPMLAVLRNTSTVLENYRCPATGCQRSLRYFIDRRGMHTVCLDHPYLEQPRPDVWRFRRGEIEKARELWRELRRGMACRGYQRVTY